MARKTKKFEITFIESGRTEVWTLRKCNATFGADEFYEILQGYAPHVVAVEIEDSPDANGPTTASLQGPHPGGNTIAPASTKICINPSSTSLRIDLCEPGTINKRTSAGTRRPLRILAVVSKSSYIPDPQEPINA